MAGGRPSKLDEPHPEHPTRADAIETALRLGNYIEQAAAYAGVSPRTLHRWIAEGRDAEAVIAEHGEAGAAKHLTKHQMRLWQFWQTATRARAIAEFRNLAQIQKAGTEGDWKASAWFLERAYPSRWGRFERTESDPEQSGTSIEAARKRLASIPDTPLASLANDD